MNTESVVPGRYTAAIDGDFVVFLIGVRFNRPWKLHKLIPVVTAMRRMLAELAAKPELGCLGSHASGLMFVQYWRSFEHLETYARSAEREHLPAWTDFNRRVRSSSGDVGIWHETYLVKAGQYETLYGGMPRFGLALAGKHVDAAQRARDRLGAPPDGTERAPSGRVSGSIAADATAPLGERSQ